MPYEPTTHDFEHPTLELIHWLEESLSYYEKENDKEAVSLFRTLLQETQEKMDIITRSNEQPQTQDTEEEKTILESIPRNSRLGQVLDRLDVLEKNIAEAEKIVKEPELHRHLVKGHPRFCEPKNPERERDEQ